MASKAKRTPIKGLGANAWFDAPVAPPTAEGPAAPSAETPVRQEASTPVRQQVIKATFYLSTEHVTQLEEYRLKLMKRGERVDKSELVRRAIDMLVSQ